MTALEQKARSLDVSVVSDIDKATRVFPVVVTLDASDGRLAPGMSVRARIPVGANEPQLAVPVDAIVHSRMGQAVFKVGAPPPGGGLPQAMRVPVQVLFEENGDAFVSSSDLDEGEMVVVRGQSTTVSEYSAHHES